MDFMGHPRAKYCPECARKHKQKQVRKWQREHKEKMAEYRKIYYKNNFDTKLTKQEKEKALENLKDKIERNKYCNAYDCENLDCIQCYENQVAKYKSCKK